MTTRSEEMKKLLKLRHKQIGASLGLLAGTTMGSGIGFLLSSQAYHLIALVTFFGCVGMAAGLWAGSKNIFKELP